MSSPGWQHGSRVRRLGSGEAGAGQQASHASGLLLGGHLRNVQPGEVCETGWHLHDQEGASSAPPVQPQG